MTGLLECSGDVHDLSQRNFDSGQYGGRGKQKEQRLAVVNSGIGNAGGVQLDDWRQKGRNSGVGEKYKQIIDRFLQTEIGFEFFGIGVIGLSEFKAKAVGKGGDDLLKIGKKQRIDRINAGIIHAAHHGNDERVGVPENAVGNLMNEYRAFLLKRR